MIYSFYTKEGTIRRKFNKVEEAMNFAFNFGCIMIPTTKKGVKNNVR